jgi:hypothetical protein
MWGRMLDDSCDFSAEAAADRRWVARMKRLLPTE